MSEQRVSQPQLAGDPSANKSKPTVASLFIAIFGALANVAALVTLAVQRQYLALLITFGVSIALVARLALGPSHRDADRRRAAGATTWILSGQGNVAASCL